MYDAILPIAITALAIAASIAVWLWRKHSNHQCTEAEQRALFQAVVRHQRSEIANRNHTFTEN
jgi:hypothetical protein